MPELFTSKVMQHAQWNVWMLDQQKLWDSTFHERNRTICSPLKLPSLYRDRIQLLLVAEKVQIQDSAMDDEPETNEIILHSSGAHGSFDKQQRLNQIRLLLSNVPECDKNATVFVGKACLYKYTYCPWGTQSWNNHKNSWRSFRSISTSTIRHKILPTKRGKASEGKFPPGHSLSGHQGGYEI